MDNKKSYVYKITCKITGEYYFGSSFYAKRDSYWGSGRKIKELISKYGKENFLKEILGEFEDRTIAHRVENQYIEKFRNDDKCLNQQLDHKFGTYSDESREKRSAAHLGEKNHNFGKHFSKEHRTKMSDAHLGKNFSGATRAKLSAALRGNTNVLGKHWRKNKITGKREWYD